MDFSEQKITVFGMGRSGLSALELLIRHGYRPNAISQGEPKSWGLSEYILKNTDSSQLIDQASDEASKRLDQSNIIVLSPGIPREHKLLEGPLSKGVKVISEIELAYQFLVKNKERDIPIIAVTGTNGKTTTVSLLGEIFNDSSVDNFIGGNIGIPFCDYLNQRAKGERSKTKVIVLELSSFQLESMVDFYPDYAALLNIYPNHGERYESVKDYADAKWNLTDRMKEDGRLFIDSKLIQNKRVINAEIENIDEGKLDFLGLDVSKYKLIGHHNKINLSFALKLAMATGLSLDKIQSTIDNFSGVKHRIQFVSTSKGFVAYNDAKSTNWDATLTALKSFIDESPKRDLYLVLGGKKRGRGDGLKPFADQIKMFATKVLLIGETTDDLASELSDLNISFEKCYELNNAVKFCESHNFEGWLLFSPAFPSFDQYQNYEKRGEHFISLLQD